MKTRSLKRICLLMETVGIVALFLPFAAGVSPWAVIADLVPHPSGSGGGGLWFLAAPTFLALVVWLQTLRSLFDRPSTKPELCVYAALVLLLMLVPLGYFLLLNFAWLMAHEAEVSVFLVVLLFGLALFAAGSLITLKRKGVASQFLAPLALRCAYIPNAVFCLVNFSEEGRHWNHLQVGAACVAATVVLYLAEIVYLTRQGLKTRPGAVKVSPG